jgi:hypothetical protein
VVDCKNVDSLTLGLSCLIRINDLNVNVNVRSPERGVEENQGSRLKLG